MNIKEFLDRSIGILRDGGITTAELDTLVLLSDVLNVDKAHLLAHPERQLTNSSLKKLNSRIERRKNHEPLAYIRGKTEFYGREFFINKQVLVPRPETEDMITLFNDLATLNYFSIKDLYFIDVGTGSGAIAITIKLEHPDLKVAATDSSLGCLDTAKRNSQQYQLSIEFFNGNLLDCVPKTILSKQYIIAANLPYVPDNYLVNRAASMEPKKAIFGGADGLDLYRKLFYQISRAPVVPLSILTESLPTQHKHLVKIAAQYGFRQQKAKGLVQLFVCKN